MFGKILEEHKRLIDYTNKNELLKKCNEFNSIRIQFVHHLLKFKNDKEIIERTEPIKDKFFEICDLFFTSRSFFATKLFELKDNEFTKIKSHKSYKIPSDFLRTFLFTTANYLTWLKLTHKTAFATAATVIETAN